MKLKIRQPALWLMLAALIFFTGEKPAAAGTTNDIDYYTCTMHPSVRSKVPGNCPICSMDLVPVYKKTATSDMASTNAMTGARKLKFYQSTMSPRETSPVPANDSMGMAMEPVYEEITAPENAPDEFTVPVQRQQQFGVTFTTVQKRPLDFSVRAAGTVVYDKGRHWDYIARVDGYISQLSVFSRGETVEKNSPLMSIFSPDLLLTEEDFIRLLKDRDDARAKNQPDLIKHAEQLVESAKKRLNFWNINDSQIAALEKSRLAEETLTLQSPFKGVVQDLDVDQGRHVSVGDHLVDIADLSAVWVWAQFYQSDLALLKTGLPVAITSSSYPNETFDGKISVIDPFMNDATRTTRVRIDVTNVDWKLRPDMYVDAELHVNMGEGLTVPVSALLPTGAHNIVFVDKGEGRLQPRYIKLGRQYGDFYEVKSGLNENERVVSSGNFLIDAEAQVQGVLKSW
jgi:RND family efflux transporter MFP subunit